VRDLADMTAEPLSVLLIDDDREDYLLTREMLADVAGVVFRLDHAATYEEGLDLLREGKHDAVLLDYRLGGRTGIELLREAQEIERRPPIILLTGKGQREIAFEALTLGVSDYLEKAGLSPALLERVILYAMRQRRQETRLEEKVRERTAELARANDALRDEDRRKNDFIAMLAHELRNPLAPIRNALEIMRLTVDDTDAIERSRAMLERQVGQMVRLIDDLLDVSRITTGKLRVQPEATTLGTVLEAAVEISRPALDNAKVKFEASVPAEPIPLRGDRVRLAQVFSNLLNNAAKYTPEGGSVSLTAGREGNEAVVSVRDSGVGIPADVLPRVFDLFTQVDRSLNRSQGGLGIGLALVQRLVQLHDGRVSVRSDGPGQGAEFTVRLPLSEA
jgi:signal transduction histidine kinase